MIQIKNLAVNLHDNRSLIDVAADYLLTMPDKISKIDIVRKTIDARRYRGADIKFIYNLNVELVNQNNTSPLKSTNKDIIVTRSPNLQTNLQPVVIGFGPAGMFAALTLAKAGLNPLIFERGADIDTRLTDVDKFFKSGMLNIKSNVQFGEGGAGTFSDGKLTTRLNDELFTEIIETFIEAGAPDEIRYLQKPHIGTDKLKTVVKNIRKKIIALGGKIFFNAQVTDIEIKNNKINAVIINADQRYETDALFMAIGHSARDTYAMLQSNGVAMEPKSFAIGVRIEHPQEFIDRAQYGVDAGNPKLPVADYMLTFNPTKNKVSNINANINRGAYTFCMCPGGQVVAAASELNQVVTNGMSNFSRDSGIANSAVLAVVTPEDFTDFGRDALCGVRFQQKYEALAFELGGKNYYAPVQTVGDFLTGKSGSTQFLIKPTYPIGFKAVDLHKCLPNFVTSTLEAALQSFNRKINGFAADDVVLTGVETRTSAPCRILRDKNSYQSINTEGLYPVGEGAGYSGGIMSSALDGMKAALNFLNL